MQAAQGQSERKALQEHVSEYGVHWNFFFTLAAIEAFQFCAVVSPPETSRLTCQHFPHPGCAESGGGREPAIPGVRERQHAAVVLSTDRDGD